MQHLIQVDVTVLAFVSGSLIPLLVGLLAKWNASGNVKAGLNLVLSVLAGVVAAFTQANGSLSVGQIMTAVVMVFVASGSTYNHLWKPLGVAGAVQKATAGFGLGSEGVTVQAAPLPWQVEPTPISDIMANAQPVHREVVLDDQGHGPDHGDFGTFVLPDRDITSHEGLEVVPLGSEPKAGYAPDDIDLANLPLGQNFQSPEEMAIFKMSSSHSRPAVLGQPMTIETRQPEATDQNRVTTLKGYPVHQDEAGYLFTPKGLPARTTGTGDSASGSPDER